MDALAHTAVLALGAATGGLVVAQLRYGMVWNRNPLEWGATVLLGAASLLLVFRLAQLLAQVGQYVGVVGGAWGGHGLIRANLYLVYGIAYFKYALYTV